MGCACSNEQTLQPLAMPAASQPNPLLTETYSLYSKHRRKPRRSCKSEGHRASNQLVHYAPILADDSSSDEELLDLQPGQPRDSQLQTPLPADPQSSKLDPALLAAPRGFESQWRVSAQQLHTSETTLPRVHSSQGLRVPARPGQVLPVSSVRGSRSQALLRVGPHLDSSVGSGEYFRQPSLIQRRAAVRRADHFSAAAAAPSHLLQTQPQALQTRPEHLADRLARTARASARLADRQQSPRTLEVA